MAVADAHIFEKLDLKRTAGNVPLPALLFIFAIVFPAKFSIGPIVMDPAKTLLMIFIIPTAINLLSGKYGRILLTDVLFAMFTLWMPICLFLNTPQHALEFAGSTGLEFAGGYLLARAYIRNLTAFVTMFRYMFIIVIVSIPLGLFENLTGDPILIEMIKKLPGFRSEMNVAANPRMGLERAQVMFPHPIHYGLYGSMCLSMAFIGFKGVFSTLKRLVLCVLIFVASFLALSSAPLLSLAMQCALIGWVLVMAKIKARWWILFGVLAVLYVLVDIASSRTPLDVFMTYATFNPHNAYWRGLIFEWGIKNVWANPVFGIGLNDWFRPSWMYTNSVDNFFLLLAMRFGIPGFLFLTVGYAYGLIRVALRNFDDDPVLWQVRRAWVFTFIGLTFTLCTVHIWASIFAFVFFIYGAGMWMLTAEPANLTEDQPTETKPKGPFWRRDFSMATLFRSSNPDVKTSQRQTKSRYSRFAKGDEVTPVAEQHPKPKRKEPPKRVNLRTSTDSPAPKYTRNKQS